MLLPNGAVMDRIELTDEYLSKFPDTLVSCIKSKDKHIKRFLKYLEDKYDDIIVYRAVHHKDFVCEDDFLGNYESAIKLKKRLPDSVELHGVSVFDDYAMLNKSLKIPSPDGSLLAIAFGKMRCKFGPATFEKGNPHHNWYIFKDCLSVVASEFEILNNAEDRNGNME